MTAALPVASLLPQPGLPPPTAAGALPAAGAVPTPAPAAAPAFTALLLGLGRGGTAGMGPPTGTAGPAVTWLDVPAAVPVPMPTTVATSTAPASTRPDDGATLPESGSDLPLPDVSTLLAALESAPANPTPAPAAPVALPAPPVPANGSPTLPGTTPVAVSPAAVATAGAAATPGLVAGETLPETRTAPTGAAPATPDNAPTGPSAGASSPVPGDAPAGDATRRTELTLPSELRARLDAVLTLAGGSVAPVDTGPTAGSAITVAFAATPAPSAAPAAAAPATAAALPAPLPPLTPGGDREAWSQALGERLLMMADRGLQSATLRLQPEHLGPLEVKIAVGSDGAAQVLFSSHHAQAREALEAAIPRLRDLFADQGLNLAQAGVDTGGSAFTERGFATGLPSWQYGSAVEDTETPVLTHAWQLTRPSHRQVDILV